MTPLALGGVLSTALVLLAIVLNHCSARLALVELALNEGLPPGHHALPDRLVEVDPRTALSAGLHVFLSRSCHACQRLIEELDSSGLQVHGSLMLRYVDRPRPIAVEVAAKLGGEVRDLEGELPLSLGADPLPYSIAIGEHGLVARAVTPTLHQIVTVARDAGIRCDV